MPHSDGAPRCEAPSDAPVQPGGRALALVYAGPVEQQVTVTLNADGSPTKGDPTAQLQNVLAACAGV